MVFSAELAVPTIPVSTYGSIALNITPKPLIDGTTVKNHIAFDITVQFWNCTETVLQSLLNQVETEVLDKVDKILSPFQGSVSDGNNGNIPVSTIGKGSFKVSVNSSALIEGTDDPNNIVFAVEIQILSCTRPQLIDIFSNLSTEILDKVNDVL